MTGRGWALLVLVLVQASLLLAVLESQYGVRL